MFKVSYFTECYISFNDVTRQVAKLCSDSFAVLLLNLMARNTLLGMIVSWNWMGEEIFMFLRESKYSVSLITVPFCPVAPCPFQILAKSLHSDVKLGSNSDHLVILKSVIHSNYTRRVAPRYNDYLYNGNFNFRRYFFGNGSFLMKIYNIITEFALSDTNDDSRR